MMRAIQIHAAEQASVVKRPIPEPGPGQVLVKVKAVTTCPQWDLHIYYGKPMFIHQKSVPFPYPPGQPGHEMTGTVERTGEGCTLKPGQTVSAWKDPGHENPGCYAEYVLMDEKHLILVPPDLHYSKVVSLELTMCVGASIKRMKEMVGIENKKCAVNGLGPAGLIALQMLKAEGASEVVGIDPVPARRALAEQFGAARCYQPEAKEIVPRNREGAFDIAIDCVGYASAVRYIMDHTVEAVALFAVQREDYILHHPRLSVIGYPGHSREAAEYALDLIRNNKLDLAPLISYELPFEDYVKGVELLRKQEAIKICFIP